MKHGRIFITGGASGLGRATALRFARAGWRVCVGDVHDVRGEETRAELGPETLYLGKGPGYPRRQIEGWSDRFDKARTWNVGSFRRVRDWLVYGASGRHLSTLNEHAHFEGAQRGLLTYR